MAAAGAILVRTMNLLAGKIRPGRHDRGARPSRRAVHPLAGRRAGVQGLPRLPGLDLRVAELDDRPRDPGPYKLGRGDILSVDIGVVHDGWVADAARTFPVGPITPIARKLLQTTEESLLAGGRAVPRRQPARRRLARVQEHVEAAGLSIVRTLVGHGVGREHARGAPDPQLRHARDGRAARGGDGAGGRADGHRRPPRGAGRRRPLGDLLAGRLAGRALRVHGRDHRRRARGSSRRGTRRAGKPRCAAADLASESATGPAGQRPC